MKRAPLARLATMGLLTTLLALIGCDAQREAQLQPGISTEADVRTAFGPPDAEYTEPDGSRLLSYPRQPEGRTNLMVVLGPAGAYRETRQVLQPAWFSRIEPGMSQEQVLRTLGRPARRQPYPLKQTVEWEWYWQDGQAQMEFAVSFNAQGKVQASAVREDLRATQRR